MNYLKSKNKKPLVIASIVIATIIIISGLFFGSYYIFISKSNTSYEKSVSSQINKINGINKSVGVYINAQGIDTSKIMKEMPANIDSLISLKEKLQEVNPTDKFKKNHNSLLEGISSNILIYKQVIAALNNPQGKDIPQAMDALMKYKDDCTNYYSLVGLKSIEVTLPTETLNLINGVYSYLNEMSRIQRDLDVKNAQAQEFTDAIDKLNTQFTSIKTDLNTQMVKVRNGSESYDDVLSFINKNNDDLSNIKSSVNITIPSTNARTCLNAFIKVLDDYNSYLQSFKYSLQTEKIQADNSDALSPEDITAIYSQANSRYNDVNKDYDLFLKAYNTFKTSPASK